MAPSSSRRDERSLARVPSQPSRIGPFLWALSFAIGASVTLGQTIDRASVSSSGGQSDGPSFHCAISADGRTVAFQSYATNLVAGGAPGLAHIFVRDLRDLTTSRASVSASGIPGDGTSNYPSVSADGRYVAFASEATNLVPGDTNLHTDVFVHDRLSASTVRVSVDSAGVEGNFGSSAPSISGDGRFVAFGSAATQLVANDTNGWSDVFVHDRDPDANGVFDEGNGFTSLESVSSTGAQADLGAGYGVISADGRVIAFLSESTTLVPFDTNGACDIFAHYRESGLTLRASVSTDGTQGNFASGCFVFGGADQPSLSADGRWVAFSSFATNLVPGDTNLATDIFIHDLASRETLRVSVGGLGGEANRESSNPSLSADGRFVAFCGNATNLVPEGADGYQHAYVRDRVAATTSRASVSTAGEAGNSPDLESFICGDGSYVIFNGPSTNLVPGDTNQVFDVFVRDRAGVTVTSVIPSTGSEGGGDLVRISGSGFVDVAGRTVRFGGAPASLVEVTPTRITARTPPGAGVVDVTVADYVGVATLSQSFTFVPPELAARYGNVNVGAGDRENVLLVNAYQGDALSREIVLNLGDPILVAMAAPSSRVFAMFAIYVWIGPPNLGTLRAQPLGIGSMVFPTPLNAGANPQPVRIGNNLDPRLGVSSFPTSPAPMIVGRRASGFSRPLVATLQGFIQDDASQIPQRVSLTNAVIVRIR